MPELANINGRIMPIEQACVPIEDRGYQFGDAVYEFLASYGGRIFAMEAHLDRLMRSLDALGFEPVPRGLVRDAITETFEKAEYERAGIYLQISRGVAPRNHAFPPHAKPQIVITVRPVAVIPERLLSEGAQAITVTDIRWQRCDIKTVQLLPNTWAKQQALDAGADDAIFVSEQEVVREGTASNVFIAVDGRLHTHPLTAHILPGITRDHIIEICKKRDIPVQEGFFDLSTMLAADEVFLTGTVTEILPVSRINRQAIGDGKPGPLSGKLFRWFREVTES